jgi:protein-disulfide isomerase
MNLGVNFGVSVPPAFFVNGLRVDGFTDNSRLRAVVDAQIRKAQEMIERGTDRRMVYDEIVKNGKETAFIVKVEDRDNTNKNIGKGSGELPNIYEEDLRYVPIKGPRYAPVTIVVFLDYECPYSKRYYEVIKSVMERHEKDIRVFIKHFPLSTHQRSIEVAKYLASALAQKKFWLLFDKIMSYPEFADEKAILRFASEVQIDVDRLKELKDSENIRRFVENDMEKGYELQIKILPTTYINGIRYEGVLSTVKLSSIIEKELINANRLIESGVKMEELYDNLVRMNRVSNLTNLENKLKKPYMEKIK